MKYLLLIHMNPETFEALTEAERDAIGSAHEPFQAHTRETGELVGFAALAAPSSSRVVRVSGGNQVAVTDGPFLESKEFLAGYYVVDCESIERACELAAMMGEAKYNGVEVRPVEDAGLEL